SVRTPLPRHAYGLATGPGATDALRDDRPDLFRPRTGCGDVLVLVADILYANFCNRTDAAVMGNGCERQLDLFGGAGHRPDEAAPSGRRPRLVAAELGDEGLVAAIPSASLGNCRGLAAEAGQRRLTVAIPALEALCRRFRGFGIEE